MPHIKPYRLHRTWHLAAMLDTLQAMGELRWAYSYDNDNSRALFTITAPDGETRTLHTKQAEAVAQNLANKVKIVWIPVPNPGGEVHWENTVAQIEDMKNGEARKPWE